MNFIDSDVNETFFTIATFSKKNEMPDSLSSLLVFITTICPAFTSINILDSRNTSSRSLSVGMICSMVGGRCFLAGLDVVVCGFPCCGQKYLLCNIGERWSKIVDPISNESTIDGQCSSS